MTTTSPGTPAPDTPGAGPGAEPASTDTLPLALTHPQMNAAYDTGEAVPLASAVTWLTRYRKAWWVAWERGWLRITDTDTITDLDQAATRLAQAAARQTAARDAHVKRT